MGLPLLMTERQACERLGVSIDTVRRERRRRNVGYVMIGGHPRYTEAHLSEYIEARTVPPCRPQSDPNKSEGIGFPSTSAPICGAGLGSMPEPAKLVAHHSALAILKRPGSR